MLTSFYCFRYAVRINGGGSHSNECDSVVSDNPPTYADVASYLLSTLPELQSPINVDFAKTALPDKIVDGIVDPTKWLRIVAAVNKELKGNFNADFRETTSYLHILNTLNPGVCMNYL